MKTDALLLTLCLTISCLFGIAQNLDKEQWQFDVLRLPNDRLGNLTQQIFQDDQGYLWFATQGGTHRYDGTNFRTFLPEPGNPQSISSAYIEKIVQTSDGYIWLASFDGKGLNRYDPQTERFTRYRHEPGNPQSLQGDTLSAMALAPDGSLWLGIFGRGLDHFDPGTGKFTHYGYQVDDPHSLSLPMIQHLYFDRQGTLWVACGWPWDQNYLGLGGLHRFVPEEDHFVRYQHDPGDRYSLTDSEIWHMLEDREGNFWVATDAGGLHRMNRETGHFEHFPLPIIDETSNIVNVNQAQTPPKRLRRIFEDRDGRLWLGSFGGGLTIWDPKTDQVQHPHANEGEENGLPSNFIWDIFQARDGSIWLCGGGDGRFVAQAIPHTGSLPFTPSPEQDAHVQMPFQDRNGGIWLGTSSEGLFAYDTLRNVWEHYEAIPGDSTSLSDNDVHDLVQDREGYLWVAGWHGGGGLTRLDPQTGKAKQFFPDSTRQGAISGREIINLHLDEIGQLWILTLDGGLNLYQSKSESFFQFPFDSSGLDPRKSPMTLVSDMVKGVDGKLWLSGLKPCREPRKGFHLLVATLDPLSRHFQTVWEEPDSSGPDIYSLAPLDLSWGEDNLLWFCSGSSVYSLDPVSYAFKRYTLFENEERLRWVISGQNGMIFLGGELSLYAVWPDSGRIQSISLLELNAGVSGHIYWGKRQISPYKWWIAYGNGFYELDIRKPSSYQAPPAVFPTLGQLRIKNRPFALGEGPLSQPLNQLSSLELRHDDFPLQIEALALQFNDEGKGELRYKLPPLEPNWRNLASGQNIFIPELNPGNYTLEVQSKGPLGGWSSIRTLSLGVSRPWWLSWWAFAAYLILTVLALFVMIQWRTRTLVNRSKELESIVSERTEELRLAKQAAEAANEAKSSFLSTVSHELRTPLTSIIGFTKLNKKNLEDKVLPGVDPENPKAQKAAQRISKNLDIISSEGERLTHLINELLDLAKIESGKVEWKMEQLNPAELIERAVNATSALFAQKPSLKLITDIPEGLPPLTGDKDRLLQVLINLISNAVKFTDSGEVRLAAGMSPLGGGQGEDTIADPGFHPPAPASGGDGYALTFSVADTGSGIPADQLDKVFERFQQVEDNQGGKPKGTGLGLPICREIVEHHGGRIWVESEFGKGSSFFVQLPLVSPPSTNKEA